MVPNKSIFIAGTDTGVGKTVVTGLLARYFIDKGVNVITQKWVQTGCEGFPEDVEEHFRYMGRAGTYYSNYSDDICPYGFSLPASPHLAAEEENMYIKPETITKAYFNLLDNFELVLVEGAGGLNVPLNGEKLIIDLVSELDIPVILVVSNKLGAINHALLSIEALRSRKIPILGLVFNTVSPPGDADVILRDNVRIVRTFSGVRNIAVLDNFPTGYPYVKEDFSRTVQRLDPDRVFGNHCPTRE